MCVFCSQSRGPHQCPACPYLGSAAGLCPRCGATLLDANPAAPYPAEGDQAGIEKFARLVLPKAVALLASTERESALYQTLLADVVRVSRRSAASVTRAVETARGTRRPKTERAATAQKVAGGSSALATPAQAPAPTPSRPVARLSPAAMLRAAERDAAKRKKQDRQRFS